YQTKLLSTNPGMAFITKLNASGSGLVYSTFLGARDSDGYGGQGGNRIAVDAAGNAYITGVTNSRQFPTLNPVDKPYGGNGDAFITVLNTTGSKLLFSTFLGGSGSDVGMGIALDSNNNIYVGGVTASSDFPVTS